MVKTGSGQLPGSGVAPEPPQHVASSIGDAAEFDTEFEALLQSSSLGVAMAEVAPQDKATDEVVAAIRHRAGIPRVKSTASRTRRPHLEVPGRPVGPGGNAKQVTRGAPTPFPSRP
ncbi:hypothetical protein, partial [Asanoa ferruginea]